MARLEKLISPLIPNQFPAFYRANAPLLVDFVQTFYQWMETEGPIYHNRRIFDYQDIDTTTEAFLVHFRKKYTPGIQLETAFNPRLLVKHALDLYRARGTPPAIDLFFRLVFGVGADVYFPKQNLFRTSDGQWTKPYYLEVSPQFDLNKFVGKEIIGYQSGAGAFVERVVKKLIDNVYDDILFISAIVGTFIPGEIINSKYTPFPSIQCPVVVGSLSELIVVQGGVGFDVGDTVTITGPSGEGGTARVDTIGTSTGLTSFELANGGYGFSNAAQILISNQVLTIANVYINANNNTQWYFEPFDQFTQPLANLHYVAATGNFASNNYLYTYYSNNSLKGSGYILTVTPTNSTAGYLFVSVQSGSLNDNTLYMLTNTVEANLAGGGYSNLTVTGNVFAESDNVAVLLNNLTGQFITGEVVTMGGAYATINNIVISGQETLHLTNAAGIFYNNQLITGNMSGATAYVSSKTFQIGLINVSSTFLVDPRAFCYSASVNTAIIVSTSNGSGATFSLGPLTYTENVNINDDYVRDYLAVPLNSTYGFPALPTANTLTVLSAALTNVTVTIGRISSIEGINPGEDYSTVPFARVFEPLTFPYRARNYLCTITGNSASFQDQELVLQSATGARALFNASESSYSTMALTRLNLFVNVVPTTNSTTQVVGQLSGAIANIVTVQIDTTIVPDDINEPDVGFNANVATSAASEAGGVLTLSVIDSGFGYTEGETVIFSEPGTISGEALVGSGGIGTGAGYYLNPGTTLSGNSHLQDSYYWQDYSYDVHVNVPVVKYKDMLETILHVAGTRWFGSLYSVTEANTVCGVQSAVVTTTVIPSTNGSPTYYIYGF